MGYLTENRIYHGDARHLLPSVCPDSVACSVWSPPYFVGKEYERYLSYEEWKQMLCTVIAQHFPLLIPGGFLVVNIADILCFPDPAIPRFQARNLRRQRSDVSRDDVLAAKALHPDFNRNQLAQHLGCSEQTVDRRMNGNNIRGGKYATQTRVHLVGDLVEKAGADAGLFLYDRRIWRKDAAWENSKWHTLSYRAVDEVEYLYFLWKPGETVVNRDRLSREEWTEWGSRAVWEIPSVRANDRHEAMFPPELPRRAIRLLTEPGDLVLDCFAGSGTTALVAQEEGRRFLGIEREEKYALMAQAACEEAAQTPKPSAKAASSSDATPLSLFADVRLPLISEKPSSKV